MAVLGENALRGKSAVGAYFDETVSFLYTKGDHITRVVPSEPFEPANLIERIGSLREGSDRLIENLRVRHPLVYDILQTIEGSSCDLFEAAAMIMELKDPGVKALMKEALKFAGKGGVQIDTKLRDNRFDTIAFLASIISYRVADVSTSLLCYSIFESLGDYFSDILTELKNRSKADHIVLCGSGFANQSLYSRIARNLKNTPLVLSRSFPIGRENGVVGGIYL
jgi:hydrogenase maturation factor HypF (carbamoyltransferase family)